MEIVRLCKYLPEKDLKRLCDYVCDLLLEKEPVSTPVTRGTVSSLAQYIRKRQRKPIEKQREESLKLEKMGVAVEHERTTDCDGRRKRGDVGGLPWWSSG